MNAHSESREIVAARWAVWNKIITSNKIPMASALGNHDVWTGPNKIMDIKYKSDTRYAKAWAMEMLNMPGRYYTFEKNGWKFIALDSINGKSGYQLDEEQYHWLGSELSNTTAPVCVFNHVPILSMGAMLYSSKRTTIDKLKFPAGDMHKDHQRIKDTFQQHQNVKLALSGHVHYIDAIEYLGVKYLCNGAVSGNWWGNPISLDEFPPVYAVIDLYEDGSTSHEMIYYNDNV